MVIWTFVLCRGFRSRLSSTSTFSTKQKSSGLLLDKTRRRHAEQLHTCKRSESLELSVCVVPLLKGPTEGQGISFIEKWIGLVEEPSSEMNTRAINNRTTHAGGTAHQRSLRKSREETRRRGRRVSSKFVRKRIFDALSLITDDLFPSFLHLSSRNLKKHNSEARLKW